MNALALPLPRFRLDLLHLPFGVAQLVARALKLLLCFLCLGAILAVLPNCGPQLLAVPIPLLFEVVNAVAKLIPVLRLGLRRSRGSGGILR